MSNGRYLDPNAVRLDHYLATNCQKLETGQRLDLLRQIADAIRFAHGKRVIHRSLGPQSILVSDVSSSSPRLQIYNWQVGVRENASTSGRVTNVENLVESPSLVYMSPEALSDSRKVTEASDVFSLGAIAFHLFASRPPASNATELAKILRNQKGLSISSMVDGAGPKLEELIQWSTHPDVLTRIGSVEDFLTLLDDVEDELTAPNETVVADPLHAKQGDSLPNGFVVKRELGQGATAKALLVAKGDKEFVLTADTIQQQRLASAVARAAVETEDMMAQRRFQLRRVGGRIVLACSSELAVYAEKLGQVADQLAAADPLASPIRVFQELYEVQQPSQPHGCQPFSNERLLNLAAAISQQAAVSSRQEVYPRGMAAERALRLGIGALSGLGIGETENGFSVEQIRERVKSRYPAAEPLPDRPDLDALLNKVGLDVRWDTESKVYKRRGAAILATMGSSVPMRRTTATSTRLVEVTPDMAEARAFEDRLRHAYKDGGFLVLTVRPSRMRRAEAELLRRFDLERVSFDDLLFDGLQKEAKELEVDWSYVEEADGSDPSSLAWNDILELSRRTTPKIMNDLLNRRSHVLLVHPGLIARYDQMSILETLRDKVGHDAPCPGLWVLVATDGQNDMPILDHAEIPLITPGQRAKVSESWIDNLHRGRAETIAATTLTIAKGGH